MEKISENCHATDFIMKVLSPNFPLDKSDIYSMMKEHHIVTKTR